MPWQLLSPHQARELLAARAELRVLDVRTEQEHAVHRIAGAVLVPIQELQARSAELDPDTPWLIVCEHGVRSEASCAYLHQLGFRELYNLRGGLARWLHEGLPLDR